MKMKILHNMYFFDLTSFKRLGQKSFKFFSCYFGGSMISWIHSDLIWPLPRTTLVLAHPDFQTHPHSWTKYPSHLVNVVCESPLKNCVVNFIRTVLDVIRFLSSQFFFHFLPAWFSIYFSASYKTMSGVNSDKYLIEKPQRNFWPWHCIKCTVIYTRIKIVIESLENRSIKCMQTKHL